jgi:hypothetical protein
MLAMFGIAITTLSGCATEVIAKKFVGPNNKTAYSMDCRGDVQKCYEKASELCVDGYQIINSTSSSQLITNPHTKQSISIQDINVAIECK